MLTELTSSLSLALSMTGRRLPNRIDMCRFIALCAIFSLGTNALAQDSVSEFHQILRDKAGFAETDFAALEQGGTVVRVLPAKHKKEVAVCGVVGLGVPAERFLQSFLQTIAEKNNPAILEIGRFSSKPTIDDLQTLTFEDRDIDDLKECLAGDCKLKLSAAMIDRLHKEVDWNAVDYRVQATRLLRLMLLDYVRDYVVRGDDALIEYHDKSQGVRLADEHRALMSATSYLTQPLQALKKSEMSVVENAIVWSKIKFGLKPVIAFNHIIVYKRDRESGLQVLVASKQIYANHYFDSSLALTAFVTIPGAKSKSYLFYENRSRTDGLEGAFGKLKRGIVEGRAVEGLENILESSRARLDARSSDTADSASTSVEGWRFGRWKIGRARLFALLFLITALAALFTLGNYKLKTSLSGQAPH